MADYVRVEYSRSRIEKAGKMISENAPYDNSVRKLEKVFEEYYHVSDSEKEVISHELRLKGYFSYSDPGMTS